MKKKKTTGYERRKMRTAFLFLSPWLIGMLFFFVIPLGRSLSFTFSKVELTSGGIITEFIGLENYRYLFLSDPRFVRTMVNSLMAMASDVPIIIFFSLFMAVILNQEFRGRALMRALFFLPVIIASGVIIQLLKEDVLSFGKVTEDSSALFQSSYVTTILLRTGLSEGIVRFFTGIIDRIFDLVWKSGVQILVFLAGLQSISPSIYEACDVEGATGWEKFWKITFPMLTPIIFLNIIYSVMDSFTDYSNSTMRLIYNVANQQLHYDYGATLAWVYFVSITAILAVVARLFHRRI